MIEQDLPIATEISEPLLDIIVAEPVTSEIRRRREIYHRNVRELYIMLTITISMAIFYICIQLV
jgi:hypothetical protein